MKTRPRSARTDFAQISRLMGTARQNAPTPRDVAQNRALARTPAPVLLAAVMAFARRSVGR